MNTMLGTPPRGTQSSAAAFFASPSSPVPRRPGGGTPTSFTSSNLRGVSSPLSLSQRRPTQQPPPQQQHLPPRTSPTPRSSQSSVDRYVSAPSRHTASIAHFLLTSTEQKTPMLIRAAQQHQLAPRSPSRESSFPQVGLEDAYPSPTRYAVDHSSPNAGAASPRPHAGSVPRAGSTRLSDVFAKMHLDPSVRSSRDRSVSNASMAGEAALLGSGGGLDDDASSPPSFSFASSTMDLEPYTTKLARTLFGDVPQSTVLSVNDTATRPTVGPTHRAVTPPSMLSASSTLRTPVTPHSPEVSDPAVTFMSSLGTGRGEREASGEGDENEARALFSRADNDDDKEEEEEEMMRMGGGTNRENSWHRGGGGGGAGAAAYEMRRMPLASSDVNLHGMSEGERYEASLGVVFQCNRTRNFTSPSFRVIPHTPERILDAADMEDDFYMNLIDWSATSDVLCVALQSCVYLWDAKTCGITELPRVTASTLGETRSTNAQLVCGLNWGPDGRLLAVGRNSGAVEVWDVETQQVVHAYRQHTDRTVSLSWEPVGGSLLASGSRDSTIVLRDIRERAAPSSHFTAFDSPPAFTASATSVLRGHETEVCGLKWAPNGAMLASGGNDNQLLLWDRRSIATGGGGGGHGSSASSSSSSAHHSNTPQPVYYLNKHTAAVKALSWNPAQPTLLASGGGSHDKSLRFWNSLTGECVHHINTGSQVCGVVWNRSGTELVTAHGYTDNQLSIWRYPSLRRIANLIGHTSRVLHLALSADGETVVSAAGDETLRFWRCFPASELREASPHLHRSFYSPSSASSLSGSPYTGGGSGGLGGSATRVRAAAIAAGRCGSASPDREQLSFMNEEVELR